MTKLGDIKRGHKSNKRGLLIWHACIDCGKERWVRLIKGEPRRLRCPSCHIANNNWRGGRSVDKKGYVSVAIKPDDFFFPMARILHSGRLGYVYEHRLTMAKSLNRCLLPWEVVHHKNGNKGDNRLENLQLLSAQTYHLVDVLIKRENNKLQKRVGILEDRVTLLEAENTLLKSESSIGMYD